MSAAGAPIAGSEDGFIITPKHRARMGIATVDRAHWGQGGDIPHAELLPVNDEFTGEWMEGNRSNNSVATRQRLAGATVAALPALQCLPSVRELGRGEKPFAAREKRDVFNLSLIHI